MRQFWTSVFHTVVCWHKLGEVENEYTSEKLVLSAIFVPKLFTIRRNLAKFWQKISFHSFLDKVYNTHAVLNYLSLHKLDINAKIQCRSSKMSSAVPLILCTPLWCHICVRPYPSNKLCTPILQSYNWHLIAVSSLCGHVLTVTTLKDSWTHSAACRHSSVPVSCTKLLTCSTQWKPILIFSPTEVRKLSCHEHTVG